MIVLEISSQMRFFFQRVVAVFFFFQKRTVLLCILFHRSEKKREEKGSKGPLFSTRDPSLLNNDYWLVLRHMILSSRYLE